MIRRREKEFDEYTRSKSVRHPVRRPKSRLTQKYYNLKRWFLNKKHPYSKLRLGNLVFNLGLAIGLTLSLFIVLSYFELLNTIGVWFIEIGTVVALVLLYFILKNLYKVLVNLRYGISGLTNGAKLILIVLFILASWQAYPVQPNIDTSGEGIGKNDFFNITSIPEIVNEIGNITEEAFAPFEPTQENLEECERLIFEKANEERKAQGLHELAWDPTLADIAREHSLDMAQNNFFSHENLKGENPTMRAIRHGYNVRKELGGGWHSEGIAENIGKMPTGDVIGIGYVSPDPESIATAQVQSWMDSPGHSSNILNSQYDKLGVGVAYDGSYYISTQNFY